MKNKCPDLTNNFFYDIFGGWISFFTNALGGILQPIAMLMTVAVIFLALVTMLSDKGPAFLRMAPRPLIYIVLFFALLMLIILAFGVFQQMCDSFTVPTITVPGATPSPKST